MNSVAILGSARQNSNTEAILNRLIAGYTCDVVNLDTCPISPFNYKYHYPSDDQFLAVIQRVVCAPMTIIATPVYWYSYSTPMKIFIDRFSDLLGPEKELGRQLRGRRFALVTSSADSLPDKTLVEAFSRFCDYLGIAYLGCAHAEGVGESWILMRSQKFKAVCRWPELKPVG
ncbi:MAG TPA: NAD(P)H-dependent oxidoreductase [Verrucomicrobiae bacterium]|jgi:multimeric flavodoxin WrbA|nr:NAD(P)H-dependent oxidoreductase [Verrucomicrobiae bacterium]